MAIVKLMKEVTGLGLKEAKELVDAAPKPIKTGLAKDEADSLKNKFEQAGARAMSFEIKIPENPLSTLSLKIEYSVLFSSFSNAFLSNVFFTTLYTTPCSKHIFLKLFTCATVKPAESTI